MLVPLWQRTHKQEEEVLWEEGTITGRTQQALSDIQRSMLPLFTSGKTPFDSYIGKKCVAP